MAKTLWYKFNATNWLAGDISLEDFDLQGIFVNVCAVYWNKNGDITLQELRHRYRNNLDLFNQLIDKFVKINEDNTISIEFLDKQLNDLGILSKINSRNGKLGGRPKTKDKENNSEDAAYDVEIYPTFEDFWNLYDKKVDRDSCERKWSKLSQSEKEAIISYIPNYIAAQPDKKYRKNPQTFLNNKSWNNEIISNHEQRNSKSNAKGFDASVVGEFFKDTKGAN